jgi:acylphosphatase
MILAKFNVIGMVQGVGFRYFTLRNAVQIGLKGFVKNLYDGSVFCEVEGTIEQINEFHLILKQGPARSYVRKVEIEYFDYNCKYNYFEIR